MSRAGMGPVQSRLWALLGEGARRIGRVFPEARASLEFPRQRGPALQRIIIAPEVSKGNQNFHLSRSPPSFLPTEHILPLRGTDIPGKL